MKQPNHAEILLFLSSLRGEDRSNWEGMDKNDSSFHIMTEIFMRGNCGNLALMMHIAFNGTPMSVHGHCHVLSKISDRLYDIEGDVTDKYKEHTLVELTLAELMESDMVGNYSFAERGPLV